MSDTFVWDASPLVHAHRADRLDVLGDLAGDRHRHVVPAAVLQELERHGAVLPEWLDVVHVDGLDELVALGGWVQRVAAGSHSRGEAAVLAWAQVHEATAIVDDKDARRAGQRAGLDVHGAAWAVAQAVREHRWEVRSASALCDVLLDTGIRWPFQVGGFEPWCVKYDLFE